MNWIGNEQLQQNTVFFQFTFNVWGYQVVAQGKKISG
jgi:hypothetical protein